MARIRKRHSPAFKAQVALEVAKQTKTIAELARQFQVHPLVVYLFGLSPVTGRAFAISTLALDLGRATS